MYYIFGAGGHGKVAFHSALLSNLQITGFIDDKPITTWCDQPVFKPNSIESHANHAVHFAVGNNKVRKILQLNWMRLGVKILTIIHPKAIVYNTSEIADGCLIAAGAIIAPCTKIGAGCIVNHNATIDHDCVIGAFTHIAPNATLCGGVKIGELCLIGAGAVVMPCIEIGDNVIVGAGAVVTKNIPSNYNAVGNPAKILIKKT